MDIVSIIVQLVLLFFTLNTPVATPAPQGSAAPGITVPLLIDSVQVRVDPSVTDVEPGTAAILIDIEATIPDGCNVPIGTVYGLEDMTVRVQIQRTLPADAGCPAVIQPFSSSLVLSEPVAYGVYEIVVNDYRARFELTEAGVTMLADDEGDGSAASGGELRADIVIETADVMVADGTVTVEMRGYIPDGCDFPLVIEQAVDGFSIEINVLRQAQPDVVCTMLIVDYRNTVVLDGAIPPGRYTLRVNNFTTTLDVP
jgi:hypothetical protein